MYTDAMENGLEVSYRPFVAVRNQHGDVLYRNSDQIKITDNILFNDLKNSILIGTLPSHGMMNTPSR